MAAGKEIRNKIRSVQNTQKITKAMEMVAASKMRKAQGRMPRCPAIIPAKNTKVMPNEMPNIFSRPKYTPTAATIEMTATACIIEGSASVSSNQFIRVSFLL